jgi:N-acetylneuraminate synthase
MDHLKTKNRVLIIAEAGVNHNGDMDLAKKLIDVAVDSGADIVKFQSSKLDKLVSKTAKQADYQIANTGDASLTQYEMVKKLILDVKDAVMLKAYCDTKGIRFLSTPFDVESIEELEGSGLIDLFKVPSGEIVNLQYLRKIASRSLPVILSTGMCKMSEVAKAIEILTSGNLSLSDIIVLHCNTEYPTPMSDVNLNAMLTMRDAFKMEVGYSDHTVGIEVPIAAVAMGATVIEKHFTMDRNLPGPDHKASLEPNELKAMVKAIRNIEVALGNGVKQPSPSEQKNIAIARKSMHLQKSVKKNEVLTEKHLVSRRPASGISPMDIDIIIGKRVNKDLDEDHALNWSDLM